MPLQACGNHGIPACQLYWYNKYVRLTIAAIIAIVLGLLLLAALVALGVLLWKKYRRSPSAKANTKETESRYANTTIVLARMVHPVR